MRINHPVFFFLFILLIGSTGLMVNSAEPEVEVQALRERLAEREDESRVEDPTVVEIFARPLSLYGQYEIGLESIDSIALGEGRRSFDRHLLEQEVELEGLYNINKTFTFFAQVRLAMEEDLVSGGPEHLSDTFLERGEIWLIAERIGGGPFSLEAGSLDFEDDRLWWWDEDLDAVRLTYENTDDTFEIALALAEELAPARTDESHIEAEHEDVSRLIAEISWDASENHAFQFLALKADDASHTELAEDRLRAAREDDSDADLTWLGVRANGAEETEAYGLLGYWIDAGWVRGDETLVESETDEDDARFRVVEEVLTQNVRGWAIDAGVTWLLPLEAEPRLTFGYAMGSGDKNSEDGTDRSFRQTGLHGNEPGFGGVQRFQRYGELLDPELSNLQVFTIGIGCNLLENSSVDLVFHDYRLVEMADELRDARLESVLTGESLDLGQGLDLVIGLEEWEQVEFEISASAFRAGKAYGVDQDEWVYGSFLSFRFAF